MLEAIISIQKSCIHTFLILASLLLLFLFLFLFFFFSFSSLPLSGSLSLETQNIRYFDPPLLGHVWPSQIKPIFGLSFFICFLVLHFPYFCNLTYVISTLASHLINSYLLGPFLQITILSLSIVQFSGSSISMFRI